MLSLHTSPLDAPGTGDAGGMNVYLKSVTAALGRLGLKVEVYTRATSAEQAGLGPAQLAPGVRVHRLPAGPLEPLAKEAIGPSVVNQFAQGVADSAPAHLVHSHYWLSGLAGQQVADAWGVRHVQTLHTVAVLKNRNLALGDQPEGHRRLTAEARLVQAAARVVAVSPAEAKVLVNDLAVPADQVTVVTPGVDNAVFCPGTPGHLVGLPAAIKRPQGYALMAGRIQPIKGQDLAIRAIAAMPPAQRPALLISGVPSSAHLDFASSLRGLARDLGVGDDVVFLSAVTTERLAGLMRGALVTLMPSHSETYGLVALESAACGTPVVAYDSTGLRFSVTDQVSGVLVDSRDPAAWAQAISDLAADPGRRARLAKGGIESGRRNTWDRAGAGLRQVYQELLAASQLAPPLSQLISPPPT